MEHEVKLQMVKKEYTKDTGEKVYYNVIELVVDGYMIIAFDKSKDNYKNLLNMAKLGHSFKFVD